MARIDHLGAARRKRQREAYDRLKDALDSKNIYVSISDLTEEEHKDALAHIEEMEYDSNAKDNRLKEYGDFFSTLSKFIPKSFSKYDRIA